MRLFLGLVLVFAVFQGVATSLGSDRGQSGLAVGAVVIAVLAGVEWVLFRRSPQTALGALGLGRPRWLGLVVAASLCVLLLLVVVVAQAAGLPVSVSGDVWWLLPGLFAQGGIAEEALFRGYLFGHLREGRSFRAAVWQSIPPFAAVHLFMFATLPWPIALAGIGLSIAVSPPLAQLYELGGRTIWAPALLHFVVQGTVKVVTVGHAAFPVVWMVASAVVPLLAFAVTRTNGES